MVMGVDQLDVANSVVGLGMTHEAAAQTLEALARFGEALQVSLPSPPSCAPLRLMLMPTLMPTRLLVLMLPLTLMSMLMSVRIRMRMLRGEQIKRARLGWKNLEVAGLLNNIGSPPRAAPASSARCPS